MPEENQNGLLKQVLKAFGIVALIFLGIVVVGFGLLVGVCGIMGRR